MSCFFCSKAYHTNYFPFVWIEVYISSVSSSHELFLHVLTLYRVRPVFEIVFFRVWCGSPWYFFFFFFFSMAAKLIGPNLDLQFFKKNHFLDEVIVFDHLPCKGLKDLLRHEILLHISITILLL